MEEKWYAVYTKPRWEKKVADTLSKKHIESYCPLNKVVRQWSDRKKVVSAPLFASYVFVHLSEKQFSDLYSVAGVINLVHWLGKPAVIKNEEISTIKRFLKEHEQVRLEKAAVGINDTIRITQGSLMDTEGTIVAIKNNMLRVALPSLGYILYAELEKSNVSKVYDQHIF